MGRLTYTIETTQNSPQAFLLVSRHLSGKEPSENREKVTDKGIFLLVHSHIFCISEAAAFTAASSVRCSLESAALNAALTLRSAREPTNRNKPEILEQSCEDLLRLPKVDVMTEPG